MSLAELITRQAGAISVRQLRVHGVTRSAWRAHLDGGRWQHLMPRVLATFTGPVPPPTRRWAALLYADAGAVLSHRTAGELWGLLPTYDPVTHISIPANRRVKSLPGLVIHRTVRPLDPVGDPPRTPPARTVLDLAGEAHTGEAAAAVLIDASRNRLVTPAALRAILLTEPRHRWRQICLEALADTSAGVRSVLERLYLHDVERAHGLPAGERQSKAGSTWRDIYYRKFRTTVELDGKRGHEQALERWRDLRRDNATIERGDAPLRFGWFDVRFHPCAVAAQMAAVLGSRGWEGSPRRCGPACTVSKVVRGISGPP